MSVAALLSSRDEHEPVIGAAHGELGIRVQHTLQAVGQQDARSDVPPGLRPAVIDQAAWSP